MSRTYSVKRKKKRLSNNKCTRHKTLTKMTPGIIPASAFCLSKLSPDSIISMNSSRDFKKKLTTEKESKHSLRYALRNSGCLENTREVPENKALYLDASKANRRQPKRYQSDRSAGWFLSTKAFG